jgi:signal transduction histidine kinase/ActR/RegA family two-component response regulator
MQTDNGNVVKTGTAFHHTLVGFVELAVQVTKARGAVLWVTGDTSAGIVASTGLDLDQSDERLEALSRSLGELDGRLSDAPSGDWMAGREVDGREVLAAMPVTDPDGERLGSLWVFGRRGTGRQDADALESVRRIASLIGADLAGRTAADGQLAAARDEAERATKSKSRFLSAANHDLRQPFQAIHLFLHLLQSKINDPSQQSLVTRIQEAVQSGETLLTSLLELSTLEAGNVRPVVVRVPVSDVLEKLIREFDAAAVAKGLRLRFMPCGAVVTTDPTLLERMLRHLIGNAIRFTAKGSVMVGCRRCGNRIRIEVWDTGYGIPEDRQAAIFEEFTQIPGPGSRDRGRGLGLGLAIVERIASLLGHSIEVRSTVGKGSVFSITLPADRQIPETDSLAGEPLSVLVIEDDPVQLMAIRSVLESWDCRVFSASSGARALAVLASAGQQEPDLVMAELHLRGGHTGLQALEDVRRQMDREVPAILMTGDSGAERIKELAGADVSVLVKPFGPDHLRNAMEAMLARPVGSRQ